jgi:hypothetical protein
LRLSKHKAHRNIKYLNWLREQKCAVSDKKAQCAHHIRLGTNGGTSIKPSDYFCIPLRNEFHTTGKRALHIIGEETFLDEFELEKEVLFIEYMKSYLEEKFDIFYMLENKANEEIILELITLIELNRPKNKKPKKKTKKSITGDPYYQEAKELKRKKDKELRSKLKNKDDDFYQMAKEINKARQKEYRDKNKAALSKYRKEQREKIKKLKKK